MKRIPAFTDENSDFLQRVEYFARRKCDVLDHAVDTVEEELNNFSFAPALNRKSAELVQSRAVRQEESDADKLVRLTYSDRQHNVALKEVAAAEFHSQFSFKPTITRKGEKAAARSIDQLHRNDIQ